jgi:hypothetical protein
MVLTLLFNRKEVQTKECKNNLSARVQETVASELIDKELQKCFIYGPYTQPPFDNYRISPIGVAEGKYSKKKRLILDLFAPHNDTDLSIHELIDKAQCSMSYVKIDDAIKIIMSLRKGSFLCKFDISDEFKFIPTKPSQWSLYCMKWKSSYYIYV